MAALACLIAAEAFAAEFVVTRTKGTGLPERGAIVEETREIDLFPGEYIALLSQGGKTIQIEGPFSGRIEDHAGGGKDEATGEGTSALKEISAFLKSDRLDTQILGSSRAFGGIAGQADPRTVWEPSVSKPGTYCVKRENPQVRLPAFNGRVRITLVGQGGALYEIDPPAGDEVVSLPEEALENGELLTLVFSDRPGRFEIKVVEETFRNRTEEIARLIAGRCHAQAARFF
ncbi:hypothetical protein GR183_19545 [Stappia sp. GBMRC 2046]|uniref:Uncharacterized protein n=1 Tax=Stappia sediminis TaxID=2692190 RepID=A0A7X3S9R1_9HYPH|nr:hypothetical protein [Stappia sediminis]MXN67109.1 hypothetical protein [Stappia sediminis]